jgi:epoxyqueuosine reductase
MKKLEIDPVGFIEEKIKDFVRDSSDNRLSFLDNFKMWDEPLIGFADGDDPIFTQYKSIISKDHLTPREALSKSYKISSEELPARLSVISWILPAVELTRKSNRDELRGPSRLWSHTRWYGEIFNDKLRLHLVESLTNLGYLATAPFMQPYFKLYSNEKGPFSNWSERHIAYAAALGTFGLSDGFITEKGIAIRCGSIVTNLVLPAKSRMAGGPYSNCLFYAGVKCQACIERCPAGAIGAEGHDKIKCQKYLSDLGYSPQKGYDNTTSVAGCGLCQTRVPCEFQNPTKNIKKTPKK